MDRETRITTYAGLILTAVGILIPALQNAYQFSWGGSPQKILRTIYAGPIDIFQDLSSLAKDDAPLRLAIGEDSYASLSIQLLNMTNEGNTPLVPGDFIEPMRIHADTSWSIVAIREGRRIDDDSINVEWQRKSAQEFEARPFLLNPGESIRQTIYLTRRAGSPPPSDKSGPGIYLTMRVVNLPGFGNKAKWEFAEPSPPSMVYLTLGATVFVVGFAAVFLSWYMWALWQLGLNRHAPWKAVLVVVAYATLSYAVAEVIAYYIFPGDPEYALSRDRNFFDWKYNLQNWLILVIHILATGILLRRLQRKSRSGRAR